MSDFIDFTVSDAELEIKKRARRRLMGASVLALLAAIALPLALKNSDEPRAVPDMQVSIPEGGEFELPQPVAENDSADSEFAEAVIEPDAAPGVPESPIDNVTPSSPEPSPPARASVPPEQPAPSQPAARLPEEPRQKSPPPRQSAAEKEAERAREAEAARALALLDGKPPAKEAGKETTTQGQTFIQVSAFSNADRAARQVKELNDQGFAAYTEKAGKVTRVRIGPLPRSEGEQVLARLKAQGHKPVLSSR